MAGEKTTRATAVLKIQMRKNYYADNKGLDYIVTVTSRDIELNRTTFFTEAAALAYYESLVAEFTGED